MNRDELARHLYIHSHDADGAPQSWRDARADQMIRNGEVPR